MRQLKGPCRTIKILLFGIYVVFPIILTCNIDPLRRIDNKAGYQILEKIHYNHFEFRSLVIKKVIRKLVISFSSLLSSVDNWRRLTDDFFRLSIYRIRFVIYKVMGTNVCQFSRLSRPYHFRTISFIPDA